MAPRACPGSRNFSRSSSLCYLSLRPNWASRRRCFVRTSMKASINLPSLASRRNIFRLTLFHKLYYHATLRDELLCRPQYVSHRIDHNLKVGIESCHTKYFAQSFLPKTAREWNHLPADLVAIRDNNLFHQALANIVWSGLIIVFETHALYFCLYIL